MIEKTVRIPTRAGEMETFISHPEEGAPFAPVVVYMDVWGIREELRDVARRIATVGYYVLLPDLYYRQGRVRHEFRDAQGKMISLKTLAAELQAKVIAPLQQTPDRFVVEDTGSMLEFLDRGEPVRRGGPIGSIGYCMGGRHVFRVAAAYPERFRAGASLHGTDLVTDKPDSPHIDVRKAKGELYCGHGEFDHWSGAANIKALGASLEGTGVRLTQVEHKGADHGYALPDRDIHHKAGANRDWEIIFAMFRRQLT